MEGMAEITYANDDKVSFTKGETVLVPAMLKSIVLTPKPNAELLEVYVK